MFVSIDGGGRAELCEPDNFRAFKVVVDRAVTDRVTALAAIGRCDGDHVWVARRWIEDRAPVGDPAWRDGFQKMLDYAATAGWIDGQGAIRAHIEPDNAR